MAFPTPTIIRSHRSTIGLQVTKEGKVLVKAPHLVPKFFIQRFIDEKKEWIEKTLAKVTQQIAPNRQYKEGETFWYLGQQYSLKFSSGITIAVAENVMHFPKALQFRVAKELKDWYVHQAKEKIMSRLEWYAPKMQTSYGEVFFSDTSSKWGTCFADNTLQFNWRLIMAPLLVLDYVVIHELAHTTEKNHSADFWRRVARFTPAFRQHRKWLNTYGHLLVI